ncbi:retinol dehydrogenase 16-like [Bacillus rossius redtenbacheri]|uniref:retinol dehydrogenase 16-like n=1 Tax=Bacillus rossius redtenbacheri TaxID=93214 RepID=UPI002FDCFB17
MRYSWPLFGACTAAAWLLMKQLTTSFYPSLFVDAGLLVLAAAAGDLLVKLAVNLLPRRLLPDLQRKAVLITGCDSGFGHMCAKRLDALGVTVYAGCLFPEGAGAAQLKAAASSRLHVVPLDVTRDEDVRRAVEYVKQTIGDKDMWAVVNNAGILSGGEVEWTSMEMVYKVFEVNTFGMVRVTKAFLSLIRESHGRVVCIASMAGRLTSPGLVPYCMSKHAVVSFYEGLRREVKKWSVSVHGIEPYFYKTNLFKEENVRGISQETWEKSSKEVRDMYGDEYYKYGLEQCLQVLQKKCSTNLHAVVDDMVDAAVGLTPKMRYVPGFLDQLEPRIMMLIPSDIMDYIVDVIVPLKPPSALQDKKKA